MICAIVVVAANIVAAVGFLKPFDVERLGMPTAIDFPMHVHRVDVYREALRRDGLPWGIDPRVGTGFMLNPAQDISKPQQLLGVLLPSVAAGSIVNWFAVFVVISFPLLVGLACRWFGLSGRETVAAMSLIVIGFWGTNGISNMVRIGMVTFVLSSFLSAVALAAFNRLWDQPGWRTWIVFCACGSILFFAHVVGPLVILPALAGVTLFGLRGKWQAAAMLSPVVIFAANSFWAVPLVLAIGGPRPDWTDGIAQFQHAFYTYKNIGRLLAHFTVSKILGYGVFTCLALEGSRRLLASDRRRAAVLIGITFLWSLNLQWFGSFIPGVKLAQPLRFIATTVVFAAIPGGVVLSGILSRWRIPAWSLPAAAAACAMGLVYSGVKDDVPHDMKSLQLSDFVAERVGDHERVLIEDVRRDSRDADHTPRAVHLIFDREVIGDSFPDLSDPVQFQEGRIFGRVFSEWEGAEHELLEIMKRWGIGWAFAHTPESRRLFERVLGAEGEPVGEYLAFPIGTKTRHFLVGRGTSQASVNRIELGSIAAPDGYIVLNYRYHPGWVTRSGKSVRRVANSVDPAGFLAIEDPNPEEVLLVDPWRAIRDSWEPVSTELVLPELEVEIGQD